MTNPGESPRIGLGTISLVLYMFRFRISTLRLLDVSSGIHCVSEDLIAYPQVLAAARIIAIADQRLWPHPPLSLADNRLFMAGLRRPVFRSNPFEMLHRIAGIGDQANPKRRRCSTQGSGRSRNRSKRLAALAPELGHDRSQWRPKERQNFSNFFTIAGRGLIYPIDGRPGSHIIGRILIRPPIEPPDRRSVEVI